MDVSYSRLFCFMQKQLCYLSEAVLRQCDELLFSGGTDVEPNRQQPLQSGNNQTRLH